MENQTLGITYKQFCSYTEAIHMQVCGCYQKWLVYWLLNSKKLLQLQTTIIRKRKNDFVYKIMTNYNCSFFFPPGIDNVLYQILGTNTRTHQRITEGVLFHKVISLVKHHLHDTKYITKIAYNCTGHWTAYITDIKETF